VDYDLGKSNINKVPTKDMRFGNCPSCNDYKYLTEIGICPTCKKEEKEKDIEKALERASFDIDDLVDKLKQD
jgi:hypothetical protein